MDATVEDVAYYGGETVFIVQTASGVARTVSISNSHRNAPAAGEPIVVCRRAEDMIALER